MAWLIYSFFKIQATARDDAAVACGTQPFGLKNNFQRPLAFIVDFHPHNTMSFLAVIELTLVLVIF